VAAKKSAKKKGGAKKKGAAKKKSTLTGKAGKKHPCTLPEVCAFLAELSDYLNNDFLPDYTLLRRAMCHLERVVLDGKPPNSSLRFCGGTGGSNEPPDPPPPPVW